MPEQIMTASGGALWQIDSAGAGLITGSVAISNATVNVDVNVSDYVSIVGSPNYNLPITGSVSTTISSMTGSVEVSNNAFKPLSIIGSPNYNLPVSVASLLGSVEVSNVSRNVTQSTTPWVVEGSAIQKGTWNVTVNTALPAGTNAIGNIGSIGAGILGSVNVSSITGALPAGTAIIGSTIVQIGKDSTAIVGSVLARISDSPPAWTGVGSVTIKDISEGSMFYASFDWNSTLIGSTIYSTPAGSRVNVTGIIASASGDSLIAVSCGSNNLDGRIAKVALANYGGFVRDYTKPFMGPLGSSIFISVSGTNPNGFITIEGFLRGA